MFGDLGKIMKLLGKLKTELPALQEKLAASEFSATTGNGAVHATVNGKGALVDLQIDRDLLPEAELDTVLIEDYVKAAVSAAQQKATEAAQKAMMELTGGVDLPPGFGDML
ncbi:MAG: YbaB/EbfC family nucleoid-associated protein [Planctomycetota bacterium]|jgi:DNA-binding YbaB/EbfC family protein